ncbi:hypothetical protein OBBRIDRAFT_887284 [Obba rivulosa]|uniref:PH domain-containing protein n=1 Tax=Obba rivulosa TaxID=1052685 RepID=A0A8E2B3Z4_9APHY|nr:hypothetical protein OBBRIDRAFT_887284 [Obba rivulosa]
MSASLVPNSPTSPRALAKFRSKLDLKLLLPKLQHKARTPQPLPAPVSDVPPPPPPPKDRSLVAPWEDVYAVFQVSSALERASSDSSAGSAFSSPARDIQTISRARQVKSCLPELPQTPEGDSELPWAKPTPPVRPATVPLPSRIPLPISQRRPPSTPSQPRRRLPSTPEESSARRLAALRAQELAAENARREEELRQAAMRASRIAEEESELEAERRRLAALEDELARAAALRAERERREAEEDARRRQALEERRAAARERRMREARLREEWRTEQRKGEEGLKVRRETLKRQIWEERRAIANRLRRMSRPNGNGPMILLNGWITVEQPESGAWKRRYYRLDERELRLFRSADTTAQPIDVVPLAKIRRVREWQDGYEELEAVPHSFAVEFTDGGRPWCMFTDAAEDKEYLVALLDQETII